MQPKKHSFKSVVCLLLTIAMLTCMVLCTTVQSSARLSDFAVTGEKTYYLWGINNNSPNFSSMSAPTGKFTFDVLFNSG